MEESECCDNFTQIVWVDTQKFGIGKHQSKSGFVYIVARYWPPGNFVGMYSTNIYPENMKLQSRSTFNYITSIDVPRLFYCWNFNAFRLESNKEEND